MAKGVKKIKLAKIGTAKSSMAIPNKKAMVEGGIRSYFQVEAWYKETTEEDKKKSLTWILQDRKANIIILQKRQLPWNAQAVMIPKNLCGPFEFYLEASLSGKRDLYNDTGLYISGYCPAKILGSKWCLSNDADDVRKTHFFSYGENVYLNLTTQGLNGHKNLRVDIFRRLPLKTDKLLRSIASVAVTDGEINIEISNTYSWYSDIKHSTGSEEFYVKVYDPITKQYIVDDKQDTAHARYLRIKHQIVSTQTKPPTNLSPLKTGHPEKNFERPALCRYNKITISDLDSDKNKFETIIYDSIKTKNILLYETIAGSSDDKMKSLDFIFLDLDTSKGCFNKGRSDEHKKEVEIHLNGVKQKTEVIKKEKLNLNVISDSSLLLLRAKPQLFFLTPDKINRYQIFAPSCALRSGIINLNVYPNIEREIAFLLSFMPGYNRERKKDFNKQESLTEFHKEKNLQLIRNEVETLIQTKGGFGYALAAKVKIDNVESSIELAKTKSQIKKLIDFYYKVEEVLSVFDGGKASGTPDKYKIRPGIKWTFDIEPPNIALALRMTNKKIESSNEIVRQFTGAIALKPILKFKIGVDLLSLLQYFGLGGQIADYIKDTLEAKYEFTIYLIFESSLEAKAELSLTYNSIEGFAPGPKKLQVEVGIALKGGIKSVGQNNFVTVVVPEADGKLQKVKIEKFKAEATGFTSILYTYEINADKKGQYSEHKLEGNGIKATIIVYAIRDGMQYNESFKQEFTIIQKPKEPWYKSGKEYTI